MERPFREGMGDCFNTLPWQPRLYAHGRMRQNGQFERDEQAGICHRPKAFSRQRIRIVSRRGSYYRRRVLVGESGLRATTT